MFGIQRLALFCVLALGAAPTQALLLGSGRTPTSLMHQRPLVSSSSSSRLAAVQMQEGDGAGGDRERSRSRIITVARPKPKPKQDRKEDLSHEKQWRVLLHNDDVRLRAGPHHGARTGTRGRALGGSTPRLHIARSPACFSVHDLVQVHTFDYVTMAIVKVVKTITRKKAHRITVQAHSMGTATVTTTWKQMAKTMCLKLQKFGLTSSITPDSSGSS